MSTPNRRASVNMDNFVRSELGRPLTPWFDSECRATSRECRRLERRFRRSLHDGDRQACISAVRRKRVLFEVKKNDYWTSRVAAEGHNPRILWRSLNNVLRRGMESGLSSAPVSHSADDFQTFFQSKVLTVRSATAVHSTAAAAAADSRDVPVQPATSGDPRCPLLMTWRECSTDEVRRMIMAAPVKSSSLDPIPTFLLRECIDVIPDRNVKHVTALRLFASLPEMAVVTPLLKKASLEPHELMNYRPVLNRSFVSKLAERVAVKQTNGLYRCCSRPIGATTPPRLLY